MLDPKPFVDKAERQTGKSVRAFCRARQKLGQSSIGHAGLLCALEDELVFVEDAILEPGPITRHERETIVDARVEREVLDTTLRLQTSSQRVEYESVRTENIDELVRAAGLALSADDATEPLSARGHRPAAAPTNVGTSPESPTALVGSPDGLARPSFEWSSAERDALEERRIAEPVSARADSLATERERARLLRLLRDGNLQKAQQEAGPGDGDAYGTWRSKEPSDILFEPKTAARRKKRPSPKAPKPAPAAYAKVEGGEQAHKHASGKAGAKGSMAKAAKKGAQATKQPNEWAWLPVVTAIMAAGAGLAFHWSLALVGLVLGFAFGSLLSQKLRAGSAPS
jgi:hypothetical protein